MINADNILVSSIKACLPVTVTAFGILGNAYILGGQIKDVEEELRKTACRC